MNTTENETTIERILELQKEGTVESANQLQLISEGETDKALVKASKKALYLLSQKKIAPTIEKAKTTPPVKIQIPFRCCTTNTAGNGSYSLMFESHVPYLGSVMMYIVPGNDVEGVKDYDEFEVGKRSSPDRVRELETRYGEGSIAVSDVPFEFAYARLKQSYEINLKDGIHTDSRFPLFYKSLGDPDVGFSVHPVHELPETNECMLSEEEVASPKRFYKSPYFDEWRITDYAVELFKDEWDELSEKAGKLLEKTRLKREATLISEAADSLFDDYMRDIHIRRLENDAYVFKIRGIHEEAEMALHHAGELKKDTPAVDIPFVQELFRHTFEPHRFFIRGFSEQGGTRVMHLG